MAKALDPAKIFERSAAEGSRRLNQTLLQLLATAFIAGFTVVFGIIAMGTVEALVPPEWGHLSKLLGALAFGLGIVFLVVGRAELFSENFFDPIAAMFQSDHHRLVGKLVRLWVVSLILNLIGGALFIVIASVNGTLPHGAAEALNRIAEEIAHRPWLPTFTRAIIGGALVALLSYLVIASEETISRIVVAYVVGVLVALGPFDHVIVSMLHVGFGLLSTANVEPSHVAEVGLIALAGNLVGGVGLVTLSHVAQDKAAERNSRHGGGSEDEAQ